MVGFSPQHRLTVGDLDVAHVDEGTGPPILLLHGWPTSSFLYRAIVPALATSHRVIAPDLPGFGASSKPLDRTYSFELFGEVLDGIVDQLGLDRPGLVVHDLGGPIGVHWMLERPGRVSRLAILNTLLYPDFDPSVAEFVSTLMDESKRDRLVSPEGLEGILRFGLADASKLPTDAAAQVAEPFPTDDERRALAAAGVGLHPDGFAAIERGLPSVDVPVLGLYGAEDRILPDVGDTFARIQRDVPHAAVEALPGVGHFLTEEAPQVVAERLARFYSSTT